MQRISLAAPWLLTVLLFGASTHAQPQPELHVLSSNGVKAVVDELQPEIERRIGRRLAIEFSTATSLARSIEGGEMFDVAVLTPQLIDNLVVQNKIAANSRAVIAQAGVGIGAREGTGVRDVATVDALRKTLLAAESVVFTAEGQSRTTIDRAFESLGIDAAMKPKTILLGPGQAPHAVAEGQAELVLTLTSEILPVPGVALVGPLPPEVQGYVSFAAGRSATARDVAGADALLAYLVGPEFAAALAKHGMESPSR